MHRLALSDCHVIGSVHVDPEVRHLLEQHLGVDYTTASAFERARIGHEVMYSRMYSRATKRNGFTIAYVHNGTCKFGFVDCFLSLPSSSFVVVTPLFLNPSHRYPPHLSILKQFVTVQSSTVITSVLYKVIYVQFT